MYARTIHTFKSWGNEYVNGYKTLCNWKCKGNQNPYPQICTLGKHDQQQHLIAPPPPPPPPPKKLKKKTWGKYNVAGSSFYLFFLLHLALFFLSFNQINCSQWISQPVCLGDDTLMYISKFTEDDWHMQMSYSVSVCELCGGAGGGGGGGFFPFLPGCGVRLFLLVICQCHSQQSELVTQAQQFVAVLMWHIPSANQLPCVLINLLLLNLQNEKEKGRKQQLQISFCQIHTKI